MNWGGRTVSSSHTACRGRGGRQQVVELDLKLVILGVWVELDIWDGRTRGT